MPTLMNQTMEDLVDSLHRFMDSPEVWPKALGGHARYFVHCEAEDGQHLFAPCKFCTMKDVSVSDYLASTDRLSLCYGDSPDPRRHVAATTGQGWRMFRDLDPAIQEAFRAWFLGFRPGYPMDRVFILSLGKVCEIQGQ